jgi:hypothetical protein
VKTPQEALQAQAKAASTILETALAETGRLGEASIKLLEHAWHPLAAQANLVTEKLGKPILEPEV